MEMTNWINPKKIEELLNYRKPPLLYHFTSLFHWNKIKQDGYLLATDSCINPYHIIEPHVVWLTSNSDPYQKWQYGSIVNKSEVSITFQSNEINVYPWIEWARLQNTPEFWIEALSQSGGNAEEWFIHINNLVITKNSRIDFIYEKSKS